jgi:ribose transport system substrate-binding protein
MSGKSTTGAKPLRTGRRRLLALPVLALLVVAVAATTAFARGGAVSWPTEAQETATSGVFTNLPFCGTKQITLGVHDGFGINAWSQESYAAVRSEAAKCPNVKQIVVVGGGSLEKSISDVNSMVAQGANAIVLIPDFGQAQLASIQQATAAGVKVVPWGADPGGTPGKDYVSYVDWSSPVAGTMWANWMVKLLDGKGNIVFLGGPAGNPVTSGQLKSIVKVFAKHPGMKLLTGKKTWPVTNWDPATAQKQMSALLAKYKKIDGIISDYGTDALAATRAMQAANRKLVPIGTLDANGLSCLYKKVHKSNPQFQLATISSRNWLGRVAARKAIAAAQGLTNKEPSTYELPFFENSVSGQDPVCVPSAAPDFYSSNKLTQSTISKYGKPS